MTTVGYGDVVPTTTGGRFIATGLMIIGFASLSLLTGIIASLLVEPADGGPGARDDRSTSRSGWPRSSDCFGREPN